MRGTSANPARHPPSIGVTARGETGLPPGVASGRCWPSNGRTPRGAIRLSTGGSAARGCPGASSLSLFGSDSNRDWNYYYRSRPHRSLEQVPEAIADFTKTLEADPQFMLAYYYRGRTLHTLGRTDEAKADFQIRGADLNE